MFASTAPTGLYSWIRSNDGRSTGLFLALLATIQLIAPLALVGPLILLDIGHAPFFAWGGYLTRYAPIVLVASVLWFFGQLWWYVETVKRAVDFHFVDGDDEPRLCRILEPLLILTGLPPPFVGVIESNARNAFACGIGRKKAVVVVTRGLIDALDDHELQSVLAHELSHIRNGDIRLMAAANIFMTTLGKLHARNGLRFTWVHALLSFAVPAVLPLSLAGSVVGRWALKAGQVSRLLIASSREFIADAEATQWTKNPAALAAALLKVDGRHRIAQARAEDDAMMIAGDSEGPGATHPSVAQRIAALARTTGSMVFNAPGAPRAESWTADTTPDAVARVGFGRRAQTAQAIARVRRGDDENALGLDRFGTYALIAAIVGLAGLHATDLDDPRALAAKFSLRPIATLIGTPIACQLGAFSPGFREQCRAGATDGAYRAFEGQQHTLAGYLADVSRARRERGVVNADVTVMAFGNDRVRAPYKGQSGRLTGVTATRANGDGVFDTSDGGFSSDPPDELVIAELDQVGCYVHKRLQLASRKPQPLTGAGPGGTITMDRLHEQTEEAALEGLVPSRDWAAHYVQRRETLLGLAYDIFGLPGLAAVKTSFASPTHVAVLDRLRARAGPVRAVPVEHAKLKALLRNPDLFIPCSSLSSN